MTDKLGAQGTICGGGRYDPLIGMLGGRDAPACGFAMGIERVLELMKECGVKPESRECDVYVVWDKALYLNALSAAERLRDADIATIIHSGSMKFGNQMKRADASGALYALVIGADEAAAGRSASKHFVKTLKVTVNRRRLRSTKRSRYSASTFKKKREPASPYVYFFF